MGKCEHKWMLNVGMNPNVFCVRCFVQFKPTNQQIPFHGTIPDKFK